MSIAPELTLLPQADPAQALRFRDRQYSAELIAAVLLHHDFFSWMGEKGAVSAAQICAQFGWQERPVDVLLTLCRASGFVRRAENGADELAPAGREFLCRGSPWFLGPYYEPLRGSALVTNHLAVLQSGKPAGWQAKANAKDWHESMLDPEFARSFTDLMHCRGLAFGQYLARAMGPLLGGRRHWLDVAGGSGVYTATMLAAHESLRGTVLEQAPVAALVAGQMKRFGLDGRASVLEGDMFAMPWPDCDLLLFSNVLHDWDWPQMRQLVKLATQALCPKTGLMIIHDAFVNDAKDGPLPVAEYSSLLMNITQGKCYSAAEYASCLADLGWESGPWQGTVADRGFMLAWPKGSQGPGPALG